MSRCALHGETAKILTPGKRVLMPTLEATCSLDEGCRSRVFRFVTRTRPRGGGLRQHLSGGQSPSGLGGDVEHCAGCCRASRRAGQGHHLGPGSTPGDYVQRESGADVLLWDGACIVHEEFKARVSVISSRSIRCRGLVHPESPAAVIELADHVGSTTQIIRPLGDATQDSLWRRIRDLLQAPEAAPDKTFIIAPTAGRAPPAVAAPTCPWMAMNDLEAWRRFRPLAITKSRCRRPGGQAMNR
ncbi:MAG: hypothetical protein CM15mP25_3860 [Gammaproteobacteria bacterium]|nr:MAG: hypothetical protein CM15mP25_3860 [Gammaproteobacteria bacterium]